MSEGNLRASGGGEMLAGGPLNRKQATARIRRLRSAGVLPPHGRDRGGMRAAFFFSRAQVAIAAVLFALMDRANITATPDLKTLYDFLAGDGEGVGHTLIDRLLADVESGGEPELWIFIWGDATGQKKVTTFSPRFTHELDSVGVKPPARGLAPIMEGRLPLAPILQRFTDAD